MLLTGQKVLIIMINLPEDDAAWPVFRTMGVNEDMNRYEMLLQTE